MKRAPAVCMVFLLSVLVLLPSCAKLPGKETEFYFDKDQYTIVQGLDGNRLIPRSFEELESSTRDADGTGLIVRCSVAGPSINRIMEPTPEEREPGVVYGVNHVLTPVVIEKIFYAGENVDIKEGETYYLKESYFYITPDTPLYWDEYGENRVYASEYNPLVEGHSYVVYMVYRQSDIYDYNGEPILFVNGMREAVYCLTDQETAKSLVFSGDENYWSLWRDVIHTYGSNG